MRQLVLIAAAALVLTAPAWAHFDSGYYTHRDCPADSYDRIDPINVVFYGWGTWDRAASQTGTHAGWYDTGGSNQTFLDHGDCNSMVTQRASAGVWSSRSHIRLHPIHWDDALGWTAVGDAHHEDFVWYCGHAVDANGSSGSGFDQGRRQLRVAYENAGHSWFSRYWGNTQNFKQCDGDYAGSDGYTVFIRLHELNH